MEVIAAIVERIKAPSALERERGLLALRQLVEGGIRLCLYQTPSSCDIRGACISSAYQQADACLAFRFLGGRAYADQRTYEREDALVDTI